MQMTIIQMIRSPHRPGPLPGPLPGPMPRPMHRGMRIAAVAVAALALLLWHHDDTWAGPPSSDAGRKAEKATCNRADFRVIVDVGHTAEAPGAKSARGQREYDFNLRLAKLIEQKLLATGFEK